MFGKSQFDRVPFNVSGAGEAGFYATVQTEYGVAVHSVRVLEKVAATRMDAVSAFSAGTLWLKLPLPAVRMDAGYGVIPNFTARVSLGAVLWPMESSVSLELRAMMPLGKTVMASVFTVRPVLWARMPMPNTSVKSEFGMRPRLGVFVPMPSAASGGEFGLYGKLYAYIPLNGTALSAEYGGSVKNVRASESEEMVLEGLNLKPGQRLIIDTDTLEISVDDEVRVDCWVTGGSFFQLKNGSNTLTFSANAGRRKLKATILWADRYL